MQPSSQPKPQMSLSELVAALGESRTSTANAYEAYKEKRDLEGQLRYELEVKLKEQGLKSVKGANYSAVITETPRILIRNETLVVDWLKNTPDIESDQYIGLKATEFQSLAKSMLKNSGEVVPGTEVEVHESLAIRSNTKKPIEKIQG